MTITNTNRYPSINFIDNELADIGTDKNLITNLS